MSDRVRVCIEIDVAKARKRPRVLFRLGPIIEQQGPAVRASVSRAGPTAKKEEILMAFEMSDSQQVTLSAAFLDRKNNPARVDGPPEWLTDSPALLTLTPAADGLSCVVAAAGPLGSGTVTVKADADLGAGVVQLVGALEVTITGGSASTVTITPGAPTEQP